ncbi:MAG: hypothetical protein JWQ98_1450 [Chlorobi bacterium]|nr:hypothetical protein [Chlorobiota bacterium]
MKLMNLRYTLSILCLGIVAMAASGCGDATSPPQVVPPDTAHYVATFDLKTMAGAAPFVLDSVMTTESGVQYKPSALRFYVSQFSLLDSAGNPVEATLVDTAGIPLKYNLTFCDYVNPETQIIRFLARKGTYTGATFSVGVPSDPVDGKGLNHVDASQQTYPLNVDNDMYWGWNPGYIFFKIEGLAMVNKSWESFYYHVGNDGRLASIRLATPFTVKGAGRAATMLVNTNRLFVTPSGGAFPNPGGALSDRVVNNGRLADTVAMNLAKSGCITLQP